MSDWQHGIADYTAAIAVDPEHEFAYFQRGRFKVFAGDLEGAIEDFTAAMKYDRHGRLSGLLNRGRAKHLVGDLAGALADLNEAFQLDISQVFAPLFRGQVRLDSGDHLGAIADFSLALKAFPQLTNALRLRAKARELAGDSKGAAEDLKEYTELGGQDLPAYS